MRIAFTLVLFCLARLAYAHEWKSELFHCTATIPDGNGWQMIEAPQTPGIAAVLAMQNPGKQSVFGINVVEKYREASISDPAVRKDLEAMLHQFGYQFIGHSTVKSGGLDWLQYPVRAGTAGQQITGVIRYTSAGGYLFSITMLRGGGKEAAQDAELQQAAESFRVLQGSTVAVATTQLPTGNGQSLPTQAPKAVSQTTDKAASAEKEASGEDHSTGRMIWIGGAVLLVLSIFFGIIARKPPQKR